MIAEETVLSNCSEDIVCFPYKRSRLSFIPRQISISKVSEYNPLAYFWCLIALLICYTVKSVVLITLTEVFEPSLFIRLIQYIYNSCLRVCISETNVNCQKWETLDVISTCIRHDLETGNETHSNRISLVSV